MPDGTVALILDSLDQATSELEQAVAVLDAFGHNAADLSVATGDRLMLTMAQEMTGAPIELTAGCPRCGELNEIVVAVESLPSHWPRSRWLGPHEGVREPTYADLMGLPPDGPAAIAALAERCRVGPVTVEQAVDALAELDESLTGPIESACVECGAVLLVDVDLQQLALRRMRRVTEQFEWDIHLLASTYQWDPATIIDLPETRRRRLVGLIEGER